MTATGAAGDHATALAAWREAQARTVEAKAVLSTAHAQWQRCYDQELQAWAVLQETQAAKKDEAVMILKPWQHKH